MTVFCLPHTPTKAVLFGQGYKVTLWHTHTPKVPFYTQHLNFISWRVKLTERRGAARIQVVICHNDSTKMVAVPACSVCFLIYFLSLLFDRSAEKNPKTHRELLHTQRRTIHSQSRCQIRPVTPVSGLVDSHHVWSYPALVYTVYTHEWGPQYQHTLLIQLLHTISHACTPRSPSYSHVCTLQGKKKSQLGKIKPWTCANPVLHSMWNA